MRYYKCHVNTHNNNCIVANIQAKIESSYPKLLTSIHVCLHFRAQHALISMKTGFMTTESAIKRLLLILS